MTSQLLHISKCWCGSDKLDIHSEHYKQCVECGTLIRSPRQTDDYYIGHDTIKSFYDKDYWTDYQSLLNNHPDIYKRTREDMSDRCLYWLTILIRYCLPPARVMEIGCAHGGLVFLMRKLGFDAIGCEISPWVVDYAIKTFKVPVYSGRIEELHIESSYFDCVILMDVLEHFTDPKGTMKKTSNILRSEGIVVIQTPCYRNDGSTWLLLKDEGHLFLFTEDGIKRLLREVGFVDIVVEPQLFPYDIFIIASKSRLSKVTEDVMEGHLQKTPDGRLILGMLDLYQQKQHLEEKLKESEADRAARLENMNVLEKLLRESEADRAARLENMNVLERQLRISNERWSKLGSSWFFKLKKYLRVE